MEDADAILRAAEEILHCLHAHQLDAVVIGAVALAAHRYVRQTENLDLGVNANVKKLRELTNSLCERRTHSLFQQPPLAKRRCNNGKKITKPSRACASA